MRQSSPEKLNQALDRAKREQAERHQKDNTRLNAAVRAHLRFVNLTLILGLVSIVGTVGFTFARLWAPALAMTLGTAAAIVLLFTRRFKAPAPSPQPRLDDFLPPQENEADHP